MRTMKICHNVLPTLCRELRGCCRDLGRPLHSSQSLSLGFDRHLRPLSRSLSSTCMAHDFRGVGCIFWGSLRFPSVRSANLSRAAPPGSRWSPNFRGNLSNRHTSTKERLSSQKSGNARLMTIPNALALVRMLTSPVFGVLVLNKDYGAGLACFTFAALTDMADGMIARRFRNQKSDIGSVLDPVADKTLVLTATTVFYMSLLIPAPVALIVASRDLGLVAGAAYYRYRDITIRGLPFRSVFNYRIPSSSIEPSLPSKVNTAAQLALFATSLANECFGLGYGAEIGGLWYLSSVLTTYTGIEYFLRRKSLLMR